MKVLRWFVGACFALLPAEFVLAQGAGVYAHSGCAAARGSVGVAEPCRDGSAVYYNPAALAYQPGAATLGALALFTEAEFTFFGTGRRFDSTQPTEFAPHLWLAARASNRVGVGLGVWAPYGLSTRWPLGFEGRYIGYDNTLRGIYIQPTVAAELIPGKLAVGAGVDIVRGSVNIHRRVDLATTLIPGTNIPFSALGVPLGTDWADADLDVDDWATTFHVGVQYRISDRWSAGARYLHQATLDLNGRADFRQVPTGILLPPNNPFNLPPGTPLDLVLATQFTGTGALVNQHLQSQLTLPNQAVVGVRFEATNRLGVMVDYQWSGWHHWDEAVLRFARAPLDTLLLDFENTNTFRLGADFEATDKLMLRAGLYVNDPAAPDITVTPLLPEGDRLTVTGGAGFRISNRFRADAGIEAVFMDSRDGSVRPRDNRRQTVSELNAGTYDGRAIILALSLSYSLGSKPLIRYPATNR